MDLATVCETTSHAKQASPDELAERFMQDVIWRFHAEHSRIYTALAFRRTRNVDGQRVIVEVARLQPSRSVARPTWTLILWNVDAVSIQFRPASSLRGVITAFLAA